jgi:hypothetical protein
VLLGRCDDGRRPQERRHDDEEDERGGHGEPSSQLTQLESTSGLVEYDNSFPRT